MRKIKGLILPDWIIIPLFLCLFGVLAYNIFMIVASVLKVVIN